MMKIIKGMDNIPPECRGNIFLALGNFDGVHRGHQKVITTAVDCARDNNGKSAALIFDPHPAKVINPDSSLLMLSDLQMKAELFASLGLDYMIVEAFDEKISGLSPGEFLNICLRDKINVKGVITGFDYSFGKNAAGSVADLKEWGRVNDYHIVTCPPVRIEEKIISSSAVRKMISEGNVEEASLFLNYYFYRRGRVIPGDGRGKQLGYPTANIEISPEMIIPGKGVYYTLVKTDDELLSGATNVGSCPTFSPREVTMEVNIIDYTGDLYDRCLTLYFISKIRDEIAFPAAGALIRQLSSDIEYCRELSAEPLKYYLPGITRKSGVSGR